MKTLKYISGVFKLQLIVAAIFVFSSFITGNQSGNFNEDSIKGMFIYNFTRYIDWSATDAKPDFQIAVIGASGITEQLNVIASRKKVNNRNIIVRTLSPTDDFEGVQIVFIAKHNNLKSRELINYIKSKGILIITEESDIIHNGAHINLTTFDGKVKFEVNEENIRKDGIKISKELLQLAVIKN